MRCVARQNTILGRHARAWREQSTPFVCFVVSALLSSGAKSWILAPSARMTLDPSDKRVTRFERDGYLLHPVWLTQPSPPAAAAETAAPPGRARDRSRSRRPRLRRHGRRSWPAARRARPSRAGTRRAAYPRPAPASRRARRGGRASRRWRARG